MNVEHTNDRSPSGELHQPNDLFDAALPRTFSRVFERSEKPISCFSPLRSSESSSRSVPQINSEGAGASRPSARPNLQLRQRNTRVPENLHPLYGKASAAHLQLGGYPALHRWWTLSGYAERNRRLRNQSSQCFVTEISNYER